LIKGGCFGIGLHKTATRTGICVLQAVSGYICYIGDRNLSSITMSIRLAVLYCADSETFTCRFGSKLKNLVLNFLIFGL